MASRWYVLHSKPNKERVLLRRLQSQGFEVFYPYVSLLSGKPGITKNRPFFPGYLFIKVNLDIVGQSTFQWMPFAIGLVSVGGKPAYVPDSLVNAIHRHLENFNSIGSSLIDTSLGKQEVQNVEITKDKYEAFLDLRLSDSERVQALFKIIHQVSVYSGVRLP